MNELEQYANTFDLQVFKGISEIAVQLQCDKEELPTGLEAIAAYPDHTVFQTCAFVVHGQLMRFGWESLGEDSTDELPTSL